MGTYKRKGTGKKLINAKKQVIDGVEQVYKEIMIGIYKITSPSGKIYIGQSVNIERRFKEYKNINSSKSQTALHGSFLKYAINNHEFEVLIECNIKDLNKYERHYQDLFKATNCSGLNCRLTGSEDKSGTLSEETKVKIGKAHKGKVISQETREKISRANKGRVISQETREKIRQTNRNMSDETRQKISNAGKLRVWSEETKEKIKQANTGKTHSKETREKISKSCKGRKLSEEIKLKMSKSRKGRVFSEESRKKMSESGSKLILNTYNGIFYLGIKSAAESLCINPKKLGKYLVGINNNKTPFVYV